VFHDRMAMHDVLLVPMILVELNIERKYGIYIKTYILIIPLFKINALSSKRGLTCNTILSS
jgi:hypothetical protein